MPIKRILVVSEAAQPTLQQMDEQRNLRIAALCSGVATPTEAMVVVVVVVVVMAASLLKVREFRRPPIP
jgi:hypothetical protein